MDHFRPSASAFFWFGIFFEMPADRGKGHTTALTSTLKYVNSRGRAAK